MSYPSAYEAWRRDFAADAATQAELSAIANDPNEIEDRFYTELSFGTAGMRGVLGAGTNRMNRYNVRRATKGLADYILRIEGAAERGVVIAHDSRILSPEFALETALVLAQSGVKALLFPSLRPVPVLSFAVRELGAVAGVAITASHNPRQYNGYKVYWEDGAQLPPERADEVLALIRARAYGECLPMDQEQALSAGLLEYVPASVDDRYTERVKTLSIRPELLLSHGADLKIVYTPVHGSGNIPVRRVLGEMGMKNLLVVSEQEAPNGEFPTVRVPNPEDPDVFRLAIEQANREGADCCFATDPDCDRLGVAVRTHSGEFMLLTGNQIGCLLLDYILSGRKEQGNLPANGAAVKSIVSTALADAIAASYGVKMIATLTGFKFIAEQIQHFEETHAHTFLFGFEESYGYLSSTFVRDKDAVNASLLVTELALYLKTRGQTLYDALLALYQKHGWHLDKVASINLPGKDGLARMGEIMQALRDAPPVELGGVPVIAVRDYQSGLRTDATGSAPMGFPASDVLYYELSGGHWVCIRPSGTEPKIKLYVGVSAAEEAAAEALGARVEAAARARLA
ncbi:MAG: phospho-sugar mutase [Oscillospiraceae bacterium]|jgi:phosphoglucomutase|nr:phospho-sugar mutase [Oscillospiraceae bacterium]